MLQSPTGSSGSLCKRRANQETAERRWRQWDGLHTELHTNKHTATRKKKSIWFFFSLTSVKAQVPCIEFANFWQLLHVLELCKPFLSFMISYQNMYHTLRKHCAVRDSLFFFLSRLKTLKIIIFRRSFGKGTKKKKKTNPLPTPLTKN